MTNVVKQFVTEDDGNQIYDIYRVLGLLSVVVGISLQVVDYWIGEPIIYEGMIIGYTHDFSLKDFGTGMGLLLSGAGACILFKGLGEGKPKGSE